MKCEPMHIFEEYRAAAEFKASLGNRGMYEQNRINERFFVGDQWYGAKCGNDRPLVRHNVIKRIGDYKMSQILSNPLAVTFSAEGIPEEATGKGRAVCSGELSVETSAEEINRVMAALGDYYNITAERVKLSTLNEKALRNAYITGSAVIHTFWDPEISTGLYSDAGRKTELKGDISCEVLDIENVYFGDPYTDDIQKQPFIIISSCCDTDDVLREAKRQNADTRTLESIENDASGGKVTVLTRFYKEYKADGSYTIKCVKVTESAVVRNKFETGLRLYPLALFLWDQRGSLAYGESEITYLIPNQIAINRMITANVWVAMTTGMPMMVINGDTVPDGISNDPGQIIKVYGSNEDVAGAIKYITPPDFSKSFDESAQSLIDNTLTQSGANEVALGDSRADNATALMTMRDAAVMPLQLVKNRFYAFTEDISRIWADFWLTCYGKRQLKQRDEQGSWYIPFDAQRYRNLIINSRVDVGQGTVYSERESVNTLLTLYEKGIINRRQFISRLPDGIIPGRNTLLEDVKEEAENDRI